MGNSTVLDVAIKRRFDSDNGIAFTIYQKQRSGI